MDSINFENFNSPADGVELTDTFDTWRKKTNGIIQKVDDISNGDINFVDGSITNTKILDGAVTDTKILDGAVTNTKIANLSIGFNKLLDNAVGGSKIFDGGITASKLDGAQTGSAPIYGIRAYAYVNGSNGEFAGRGFSSISRLSVGKYSLTLSQTPTNLPIICATADSTNYNVSAAIYDRSSNYQSFKVRTGYEDGEAYTFDAFFSVIVIY